MLIELFLGFVEFLASLPVWGEIWCLGVMRRDEPTKRRAAQIMFGAEFLVLLVAALVGVTLDLTVESRLFFVLWIGALAVIAVQILLGVALFAVRRIRKNK